MIERAQILKQVHQAAEAYCRIASRVADKLDNEDLKFLVSNILVWQAIGRAEADSRVSEDAIVLARWEASNFADKLISAMKQPIGISALAHRLGIHRPSLEDALRLNSESAVPRTAPPSP